MSRPVIGISTYREPVSWGEWRDLPAVLAPASYVDAVSKAGATPVLLPPFGPADDISSVVRRLDGLVLAGGSDVNPSRYSEEPHERTRVWRDDRDISEMALLHVAEDLDLPVLGVCRGMQLMAVTAGGSLLQHVPDIVGHTDHSPGAGEYGSIEVSVVPGSHLESILGSTPFSVKAHHHQAVASHPGFTSSALDSDGIIQAMEASGRKFCIGVQWHPEVGTDQNLFRALVQAASSYQ